MKARTSGCEADLCELGLEAQHFRQHLVLRRYRKLLLLPLQLLHLGACGGSTGPPPAAKLAALTPPSQFCSPRLGNMKESVHKRRGEADLCELGLKAQDFHQHLVLCR
jgi:hypothetical protein